MISQSSGTAMESTQIGPPKLSIGLIGWLRKNLFNGWLNTLLTLVALWIFYQAVSALFSWGVWHASFSMDRDSCNGIEGACWTFVFNNWYLYLAGTYPWEEKYRLFIAYGYVIALGLVTFHPLAWGKKWTIIAWFLTPLVFLLIIKGGWWTGLNPVDSDNIGGFTLTLILSVFGIVASFPIGIMLALGRRSQKMPIVKSLCIVYIEMIRGVPLITILFMSSVVLPLFFPESIDMDKVLRAQIGIILFSAAYQAETVRGGLQAISRGQEEAAMAIGLNYWQTMSFIILPQALRIMIPALVSGAIGLFKDTSLVLIIGLIDFLYVTQMAAANPKWLGREIEGYAFIALIYWICCFSMSRYSMRLEKKLRAGQH